MNVLVLGTGLTAVSVQRALVEAVVTMVEPDELLSNDNALATVQQADQIVISPGIPPTHPIVAMIHQQGKKMVTDLDILLNNACRPIAAITGTNGKTTVVKLVQFILQFNGFSAKIGGNIGIAMLEFLQGDAVDYWIIELSSFQLYYSQPPSIEVSCWLNVADDHRSWHQSFDQYCASKQKIHSNASICVANADQELTQPKGRDFIDFAVDDTTGKFQSYDLLPSLAINFAAAYTVCCALTGKELTVPPLNTVKKNLPRWSKYRAGIEQLNDYCWTVQASKATNVAAAQAVIDWLYKYWNEQQSDLAKLTVLIGGDTKGVDISQFIIGLQSELRQKYPNTSKHFIIFGAAHTACNSITNSSINSSLESVTKVPSLAVAIAGLDISISRQSSDDMQPSSAQSWVVLVPACSSLDEFQNYAERGDTFQQLITDRVNHGH